MRNPVKKFPLKSLSSLLLAFVFLGESYGKLVPAESPERSSDQIQKASAFIGESKPKLSRKERERMAVLLLSASKNLNLPQGGKIRNWDKLGFLLGVVKTESGFYKKAKSHKGALGLMQVMPETAKWLAKREGIPYSSPKELYEPEMNLRLGVLYLNYLFERTNSVEAALLSYNAGLGGYKRFGGIPSYSKSIFKHYEDYKSFSYEKEIRIESLASLYEF